MKHTALNEITDDNFRRNVAAGMSIVVFYKDLCPFCNAMKKIILKFSGQPAAANRQINYFQINRETNPLATEEMGVERVPAVLVFRDGIKAAEKAGDVTYRDLEKMIA